MTDILLRNNVKVYGQGTRPMIFAHGFGCDQNMWRYVTPAFEKDYKIVLFDYVGSGKSDASKYQRERYKNLNGYAQDILDVVEALDLRDAIFVGHSVSAIIGLLAALKKPRAFSKLIYVSPNPCYINDGEYTGGFEKADIDSLIDTMEQNYMGWASYLAPVIMKNDDQPELTEELAESFCSTDPVISRNFAEATFYSDARPDLPKSTIPSLILQCTDDAIAPMSVGEYMAQHTPHSTLRVMTATGHCPHLSAPEETIDLMKAYLN